MAKPNDSHWIAAKKVLRYLKGTMNFGLLYTDKFDVQLAGFSDSNWVGNPDDRRSTTGYAFNIGSKSYHGAARNNQLFLYHP